MPSEVLQCVLPILAYRDDCLLFVNVLEKKKIGRGGSGRKREEGAKLAVV